MWVALYHARHWSFFPKVPPWMQAFFEGGYAGVDIFFVISGVIMALTTQHAPAGAKPAAQFLFMRFARVYTGWWPVMLLSYLLLSYLNAMPPNVNLVASVFLYPSNFSHNISSVIWTLAYELYFYLMVAASLLLPPRWRNGALGLVALGMLVIVVYTWATGGYTPAGLARANYITWFYAGPIVLEFFAGYFLYRLLCRRPTMNWLWWALATLLLAAYATYFGRVEMTQGSMAEFYYWSERTLYIGLAACALVGTALLAPVVRSPVVQWLATLGNYSFAIYLLHNLVFQVLQKPLLLLNAGNRYRSVSLCLVIVVLILTSVLYYRFIEHPIYEFCRRKIRQWLSPRPSQPLPSSA